MTKQQKTVEQDCIESMLGLPLFRLGPIEGRCCTVFSFDDEKELGAMEFREDGSTKFTATAELTDEQKIWLKDS